MSSEGVVIDSDANGPNTHPGGGAQEQTDKKCKLDNTCSATKSTFWHLLDAGLEKIMI